MNLPWLPETKLLLIEEERLLFLRLRRGFSGQDKVFERREYGFAHAGLKGAVAALKNDCQPQLDDLLLLGLPLAIFTIIHFTLPLAAAENLEAAVGYELMRHVPHELKGLYWRYRCEEEEDRLAVSVTLAPKAEVDEYLSLFSAAGFNLSAVFPSLFLVAWMMREPGLYVGGNAGQRELVLFDGGAVTFQACAGFPGTADEDGFFAHNLPLAENRGLGFSRVFLWSQAAAVRETLQTLRPLFDLREVSQLPENVRLEWSLFPYSIDLISPAVIKRRRLWLKLEVAAALFLLAALIGQPLAVIAGKQRHLHKLEKKLEVVRQEADKLSGTRKKNQLLIDHFELLAHEVRQQAVTIDVLKELTEVIPQDTWLRSLTIRSRKLYLSGTSSSATNVVKALEDSPLFKEVHFDSPVVKKGSHETFKIVVDLE
jgi:hypothetical protein